VIENKLVGGEDHPFEKDEMERFHVARKLEAARQVRGGKKKLVD